MSKWLTFYANSTTINQSIQFNSINQSINQSANKIDNHYIYIVPIRKFRKSRI